MIVGNTIYFGYGDMIETFDLGSIRFIEIKESVEIGKPCNCKSETDFVDSLTIHFSEKKAQKFKKDLSDLKNSDVKILKYEDTKNNTEYTFDFSHYNEKSVDMIIEAMNEYLKEFLYLIAC